MTALANGAGWPLAVHTIVGQVEGLGESRLPVERRRERGQAVGVLPVGIIPARYPLR